MKTLKEKKEKKKVREENKDVSDLNSLHTKIAMILQTFFFISSEKKQYFHQIADHCFNAFVLNPGFSFLNCFAGKINASRK